MKRLIVPILVLAAFVIGAWGGIFIRQVIVFFNQGEPNCLYGVCVGQSEDEALKSMAGAIGNKKMGGVDFVFCGGPGAPDAAGIDDKYKSFPEFMTNPCRAKTYTVHFNNGIARPNFTIAKGVVSKVSLWAQPEFDPI